MCDLQKIIPQTVSRVKYFANTHTRKFVHA
jgi:hypothetical protein